jgi:hypothetical protein
LSKRPMWGAWDTVIRAGTEGPAAFAAELALPQPLEASSRERSLP